MRARRSRCPAGPPAAPLPPLALALAPLLLLAAPAHAVSCFSDNATLTILAGGRDWLLSVWPADPFPEECRVGTLNGTAYWGEYGAVIQTNLNADYSAGQLATTDPSKPQTVAFQYVPEGYIDMIAADYTMELTYGVSAMNITGTVRVFEYQLNNYTRLYDGDGGMTMEQVGDHTRFCMTVLFNSSRCWDQETLNGSPTEAEVTFELPDSGGTYTAKVQTAFAPTRECNGCFSGSFSCYSSDPFCFDCNDLRCEKSLNSFSSAVRPTATLRLFVNVPSDSGLSFPISMSHTSHTLSTTTYAGEALSQASLMILYESKISVSPPWGAEDVKRWGLGPGLRGSVDITVLIPTPPDRPDLAPLQLGATFDTLPDAAFDIACPDSDCTAQIREYLQKVHGNDDTALDYAPSSLLVQIRDQYGMMVDRVTASTLSVARACFTRAYQHFRGNSVVLSFQPLSDPCDLRQAAPTLFTLTMYELATVQVEDEEGAGSGGEGGAGGSGDAGSDQEDPAAVPTRRVERQLAVFQLSIFEPSPALNELVFDCDSYVLPDPATLPAYAYDFDCRAALEHARKLIVKGRTAYKSTISTGPGTPPIETLAWTNQDLDNVYIAFAACVIIVVFAGAIWAALSVRTFRRKQGAMNE